MKDKYLPIGTVVMLKGGEKALMINGFCVNPPEEENLSEVYDYSACFYPEGLITLNNTLAFNHDDIDNVLFEGYETEDHKDFEKILVDTLEEMKRIDDEDVETLEL